MRYNPLFLFDPIVAPLTYSNAAVHEFAVNKPDVYMGEEAIVNYEPVTAQHTWRLIKDIIEVLKNETDFQGDDSFCTETASGAPGLG
jgi:hypothetical protein